MNKEIKIGEHDFCKIDEGNMIFANKNASVFWTKNTKVT